MNILARINLFINASLRSLRVFLKPLLWIPFFIFALIDFGWLFLLINFYYPPINRLMTPFLLLFYDEMVLHYPHFYFTLPQLKLYGSMIGLQFLFGVMLYSAGIISFAMHYDKDKISAIEAIGKSFKNLPRLLPVWLIKTALTILVFYIAGPIIVEMISGSQNAHLRSFFTMQMIGLVISCLFIYAYPAILLGGKKILPALGHGLKVFKGNIIITFLFHLIPWLITFPIGYLITAHLNTMLTKFSTGVLEILMTIQIFAGFISSMLLYAAITFIYKYQEK